MPLHRTRRMGHVKRTAFQRASSGADPQKGEGRPDRTGVWDRRGGGLVYGLGQEKRQKDVRAHREKAWCHTIHTGCHTG